MPRFLSIVLGPELFWVFVCLLVRLQAKRGQPPTESVAGYLDDHWHWLPFIFVPLTFLCFLVPGASRGWLLARVDLAIAVGLVVAATIFANGMVYHKPSSGPGAGTAYLVIPSLGYVFALICSLTAAGVIWWRQRT